MKTVSFVPVCAARFAVFIRLSPSALAPRLFAAVERELSMYRQLLGPVPFDSLFVEIDRIDDAARDFLTGLLRKVEASFPAKGTLAKPACWPERTLAISEKLSAVGNLRRLRKSGFNRLSLTFAAAPRLCQRVLETGEPVLETGEAAREAGFSNVNLDFWFRGKDDVGGLRKLLSFAPEHVSTYPGRRLSRARQATILREIAPVLRGAGYLRYEVAHFAKPGRESRQILKYMFGAPYLGLGPGASSFFPRGFARLVASGVGGKKILLEPPCTFTTTRSPARYIAALERGELPIGSHVNLSRKQEAFDRLFLFLRTRWGLPRKRFRRDFGFDPALRYGKLVRELRDLGLLRVTRETLRLSEKGFDLEGAVIAEFAKRLL